MSRTRRILVIAALIVFGLLAPAQSEANLTHCGGPWQGSGDTVVSTCRFRLGGGAVQVIGLAVAAPDAHVKVELRQYPSNALVAECSGAGPFLAQCSIPEESQLPITSELTCTVHGVAVAGVYSCRTV
jgi:hypothetical protein